MIKTSPLYQQLFKEGAIQEYRVKIGDVVYGHDTIKDAPSLQENLLDKSTFTVGSFTISVLKLKLKVPSEEIPHNASVVFSYRYNNGELQSEWVDKFNGRITKRTKYTDEVTSIEAKDRASNYDVFLDYFGDEFEKYPANTRKVAQLCANHLGLTIENINDVINLDIVEYPNELTMVEMLKNIARNSGGNWTITENNKLKLVVLMRDENFIIDNVEKTFVENIPRPQINSEFELEQVLTLKCYFKIQLGDLI